MITPTLIHNALGLYYSRSEQRFAAKLKSLEKTQREKLAETITYLRSTSQWESLSSLNYERLRNQLPVREYHDYQLLIESQMQSKKSILCPKVSRYEPTSGSTSSRKWIPYSPQYLSDINKAAAVWMGDVYKTIPKVKRGPHYWSLSWLPQELRQLTSSDDSDLFPWWQRVFLKNFMATPNQLALAPSNESAWRATLAYLFSSENLSLLSVWSPSFLLKIIQDLQNQFSEIQADLLKNSWGSFAKELSILVKPPLPRHDFADLRSANCPQEFLSLLWPELALISSWDSGPSKMWAEDIKNLFPHTQFQGKGLWATEGVVSFPYQNKKVLALESHFFEFKCLNTGKFIPSWQLEIDQEVQPLLWTSGGLLRYPLQDRLRVTGFINKTPTLEFIGRLNGIDMVGEKMDIVTVQQVFERLDTDFQCKPICMLAVQKPKPCYVLICRTTTPELTIRLEETLQLYHHYKVARELGQLQASRVHVITNIHDFLEKTNRSKIQGQNKLETIRLVDTWNLGDS